jgi:hypothetical protein
LGIRWAVRAICRTLEPQSRKGVSCLASRISKADGPATLGELTQRIGIPRRTTRIVADAMVALGFVERQGDRYQNGPVADSFLSGRNPTDLRLLLRYFNRLVYPTWTKLEEAVRAGQAPSQQFKFTEEDQRIFSEGVEDLQPGKLMRWPRIMTSASIARCWISAAARVRF